MILKNVSPKPDPCRCGVPPVVEMLVFPKFKSVYIKCDACEKVLFRKGELSEDGDRLIKGVVKDWNDWVSEGKYF